MDLITQRMKLKDAFPNFSDIAQRYGLDKDKAEFIRKGYTPSEIKFVDGEKAVVSYINTAAIDRDSEVTLPEGGMMDDYRDNPVVMFGHDYKALPVGKCDSLKLDSKGWQAKTVYANTDKATEIYEYRRAGFPLAESIGFIPIESIAQGESGFDDLAKDLVKRGAFKRGDISKIRRIHSKWAMLEYSDVPIPSNPEALQIAIAKGLVLPEIEIDLITKPEETDEFIRIPVDSGNHEGHRIRTIEISAKEGISALYCGTDKVIMTYLFDKDSGWTMAKAKAWVKEHEGKSLGNLIATESDIVDHKASQEEIIDEIDYLTILIKENGMNETVKKSALEFSQKVIVQLKDELPKDNAEIMLHIGRKALGYDAIEHWDIGKNGERIKGLDLRLPANDIAVEITPVVSPIVAFIDKAIGVDDILEAIKRVAKI